MLMLGVSLKTVKLRAYYSVSNLRGYFGENSERINMVMYVSSNNSQKFPNFWFATRHWMDGGVSGSTLEYGIMFYNKAEPSIGIELSSYSLCRNTSTTVRKRSMGVRPTVTIPLSNVILAQEGAGTKNNPYTIE
ncbi:MAG: hypothetical protein HFJ54_08405 [Clostridia bacterium]|nr:hypothetical protein [Clostridia bacterium]